jgi:hypothetical protein
MEPRKRIEALETVPMEMYVEYTEVMKRIEHSGDKDTALRILSWIFRAQRTLYMDGLLEALVV